MIWESNYLDVVFMALLGIVYILNLVLLAIARYTTARQDPRHLNMLSISAPHASSWRFNYSSPAPHYFSSVQGVLKQWSQVWFPAGHTIAAVDLPPFTKLYHARKDSDLPPRTEWLALDIGMSYGLMGSDRASHMLTYINTQPVKLLYFDGLSATVGGGGPVDSQFLTLFGNTTGPDPMAPGSPGALTLGGETVRMKLFCAWLLEQKLRGNGWGFEGLLRTDAGFEIIWCDFSSSSLKLTSWLDISAPMLGKAEDEDQKINAVTAVSRSRELLKGRNGEPFLKMMKWSWFESAAHHYDGEKRVHVHQCGILNWYSPDIQSQIAGQMNKETRNLNLTSDGYWNGAGADTTREEAMTRLIRRRREHNLASVSISDANNMRKSLVQMLQDINTKNFRCSGLDWLTVGAEIYETYVARLMIISELLSNGTKIPRFDYSGTRVWLSNLRDETHALLLPFLEYPSNTTVPGTWSVESSLYEVTFGRCHNHYTQALANMVLNRQEEILKWSVEEVMSSICQTVIRIGFSVEDIWATDFNFYLSKSHTKNWLFSERKKTIVQDWYYGLQELMAWLGWADLWSRCEETCGWNEFCYMPTTEVPGWAEYDLGKPKCATKEAMDKVQF